MQQNLLNPARLSQLTGETVSEFTLEPIHTGYTSEVCRVRTQDRSFIIKQPAATAFAGQLADRFHAREKEERFYRDLKHQTRVRTPACLFLESTPFLLGLEDIGDEGQVPVSSGADHAQVLSAMRTLARLHSDFEIARPGNLTGFRAAVESALTDMEGFVTDVLTELPPSGARDLLQRYATNSQRCLPCFDAVPHCFSHMDFRLDNLRFSRSNGLTELTVLDWGEYGLAPAGFDVATFLVTSVTTENRRLFEQEALRCYRDALAEPGSFTVSPEALLAGYRLSLLPVVYLPALMLSVDQDREPGRQIMMRCLAAVEDHADWLAAQLDTMT